MVWGEPTDEERVAKAEKDDIPATLDYLEDQLPADGFLFGDIGVADIAIASFFRNGAYAASKPMTNAGRVPPPSFSEFLTHSCVAALLPFEDVERGAAIKGRRQALLDAGAPLTIETMGVREPRKGYMPL